MALFDLQNHRGKNSPEKFYTLSSLHRSASLNIRFCDKFREQLVTLVKR